VRQALWFPRFAVLPFLGHRDIDRRLCTRIISVVIPLSYDIAPERCLEALMVQTDEVRDCGG
jgi:hypothetical protein